MKLTFSRLAAGVLLFWLLAPVLVSMALPDWPARGQFGDVFGVVNALFSGLAFAGLFWALQLQQEQLSLQREELKLQREEMAASRKELSRQVEAQHALFRASAAQITVASVQAKIEALKLDAEQRNPGSRDSQIKQIKSLADVLASLSEWVENGGERAA